MTRSFTDESGLFDAPEWYMLGRKHAYIDADHAVFRRLGHAEDAAYVGRGCRNSCAKPNL